MMSRPLGVNQTQSRWDEDNDNRTCCPSTLGLICAFTSERSRLNQHEKGVGEVEKLNENFSRETERAFLERKLFPAFPHPNCNISPLPQTSWH